jgi:diguanylate cyclase (GGDEF)-like protein
MKTYWLLLLDCGKVAKQLPLGKDRCVVGRAEDTDLTLSSSDVSRHHAAVIFQKDHYLIEDLNSTNGTYVNGRLVTQHALKPGDEITIGDHSVLFDDGTSGHFNIEETEVKRKGKETDIISNKFTSLGKKISSKSLRKEFEDIEKFVRKSRKRLATLANADKVTGIFNRQYFDRIAAEEFDKAQAAKRHLSILFVDLDHFKDINDNYGHQTGDDVLRAVAWLIQKACRNTDIVARYGGEEIVVVLPSTIAGDAVKIGEEIREIVAKQTEERLGITITVSVGVASYPEDGVSLKSILEKADQALYQAKQTGRNRVCMYNDQRT